MTMTPEFLGDWAERQAGAVILQKNGQTFRNMDKLDDHADLWLAGTDTAPALLSAGLRDGPIQVKGKSSSTYRRKDWTCSVKGTLGAPREEHGLEYWRFLRYTKRGVRALIFVERRREIEPRRFIDSECVLVCHPRDCAGRVGLWRRKGRKPCDFIFFDRSLMQPLGRTALATNLLRFR